MIRELAFKLLCRRHRDEIYRYVRSMLGNAADAEDATQEVLLRLWQHLPEIALLKARAWLYRTSRNYCVDQIRRRSMASSEVLTGDSLLEEIADDEGSDPSRGLDLDHLRRRLDAALQALPENLRSVFILYEVNGLRYREIGEHLGIPINSVKVHLLRARRRLQDLLRKESLWTKT